MQEDKNYQRIYLIKGKNLMKATLFEGGALVYTPRSGIAYHLQKDKDDNIGKTEYIIVRDYGNFYKEYATNLPIAKGPKKDVPLYIETDATMTFLTEESVEYFVAKSPYYKTNFYRLYASGLNAIYEYQSMRIAKQKEQEQQKVKTLTVHNG